MAKPREKTLSHKSGTIHVYTFKLNFWLICYGNRTILLTQRRVLLANCPHEAECVNSQVVPCNACLQVGPCVSPQTHFVGLVSM